MTKNNQQISNSIAIQQIQPSQIAAVKNIIWGVCQDIFQVDREEVMNRYDDLIDLDDIEANYFLDRGIFLVLVDDNKIVGSGGIKRFDAEICELKRMWFLPEYRGKGYAKKMSNLLFYFAKENGYKKVRIDVFSAEKQARAINFYRKIGFYNIERYFPSTGEGWIECTVFMEKIL